MSKLRKFCTACSSVNTTKHDNITETEKTEFASTIYVSTWLMSAHLAFIGCQLRRVIRSLDTDSIKMNVHAFVMSRVDYCNAVFARSPRYITDKLQCVLNAAARLVTGTRKFNHGLSHLLHAVLHWLDVPEHIHYPVQTGSHSAPLSAVQGSRVPGQLLYTSLRHS